MDNKHISNTIEATLEDALNYYTEPNVESHATINTLISEKAFDAIINNIKAENVTLFHDETNDFEDFPSIAYKSIGNQNEKQNQYEISEATTSYEKDVNISESNLQEVTDTKLVDGKIVSMHTSSPSTAFPIMKILSPKSGPHICLECCFKCNKVFRELDNPLHICKLRSIDKQNEFLKIEPSLCVDSCLCEFCWRNLEKIYKSKVKNLIPQNRKEESLEENKSRLLERHVKKNQSQLTFIQSTKLPSCLYNIHNHNQGSTNMVDLPKTKEEKEHDDNKIPENEVTCQSANLGITNDNSLQNLCQIDIVEVGENESEINGSHQVVSGHNDIENNQRKLNSHVICSVDQYRSSMDLKEGNQCMNKINTIHKTAYLNETDNSMYSFIAAVEPPNVIVNPVTIKRKQSIVICDTIPNKDVKKRRLNEKYSSYENNSTDDNTTKPNRNKNIAHESQLQLKHALKKMPYFHNREKSCKKRCAKNSLLDKYISDSDSLSDTIILSDSGSLSDSEIIVCNTNNLFDSEIFSDTDSEEIFPDCGIKETDYLVVASDDDLSLDSNCEFVKSRLEINPDREIKIGCNFVSDSEKSLDGKIILNGENILDSVKDSNCEMVPDAKTESDSDEQSHINISVAEEKFNNKELLSTFKIVSNVQNGSDQEILLDGDKVLEIASLSDKGMIKYKIIHDDEIKPSGIKGSTCIIICDNDEGFHNKEFSTHKINVLKGSNNKILLDGEKVEIVSISENRKAKCEIEPFDKKESNKKCIVIFDNEKEYINKHLSTFKIISNVKEGSDNEVVLNGDKIYEIDIDYKNKNIKYIIVSNDQIKSSINPLSQCTTIFNNEKKFNQKCPLLDDKKFREMFSQSENVEEYNYKKVSDIKLTPNCKIIVNDLLSLKTLNGNNINNSKFKIKYKNVHPSIETVNEDAYQDTTKEYFSEIFSAIKYFFQNTENQSLKELYFQIGNEEDMLLYLLENFRMLFNGELVISETADEYSKVYINNQKTTLYNCFGDPKDSINASKPFIHPSSHLHQYSKRLSSNIEPLIIKDITTTSTSTRSNTIASPKNNVALNKCERSKLNNFRTSKCLPLFNSVKSRLIPYFPDPTFTPLIVQHQTKMCNIQFPVAIKKKTVSKSKVVLPQILSNLDK